MKFAFDIGGVISKYPDIFRPLIAQLTAAGNEVHVITDMPRKTAIEMLAANAIVIPDSMVHGADFETHGEFCKAILLRDLGIDMLFDDFGGYTLWDSQLGPAPVRLLLAPDPFKPYYALEWRCESGGFGRGASPRTLC